MSIEGLSLTTQDLDKLIADAEAYSSLEHVVSTGGLFERIQARKAAPCIRMPWSGLHDRFDLRSGELTIWAGESGSGKSMLIGQVMGQLLTHGVTVFIASMEMAAEETVARICNQCACGQATDGFIRDFCNWADGELYIYDVQDKVAPDRILAVCRAVASSLGATHIVIDSLTKCGIPTDGDRALTMQADFVDRLQHLAKSTRAHVHLVAHLRKPDRYAGKPSKHDVRGAGQITDLADNVVLLTRNHAKEEAAGVATKTPEDIARLDEPDCWMKVAKQRHHSWEGSCSFNYLPDSQQFVAASQGGRPLQWNGGKMPWDRW